jgi:hypothetical protein
MSTNIQNTLCKRTLEQERRIASFNFFVRDMVSRIRQQDPQIDHQRSLFSHPLGCRFSLSCMFCLVPFLTVSCVHVRLSTLSRAHSFEPCHELPNLLTNSLIACPCAFF